MIVPSRALYEHLTDRVGNIGELSRYLELWKGLGDNVVQGLLAIAVVEHDELTDLGEYLPTGNDGRAAEGRARAKVKAKLKSKAKTKAKSKPRTK